MARISRENRQLGKPCKRYSGSTKDYLPLHAMNQNFLINRVCGLDDRFAFMQDRSSKFWSAVEIWAVRISEIFLH